MEPKWKHHTNHDYVTTIADMDIYQLKLTSRTAVSGWYIVRFADFVARGDGRDGFFGNSRLAIAEGYGARYLTEQQRLALKAFMRLEGHRA